MEKGRVPQLVGRLMGWWTVTLLVVPGWEVWVPWVLVLASGV